MQKLFLFLFLIGFSLNTFAQQRLIPYRIGDKWGLADNERVLIVPAVYDTIKATSSLILWAKKDNKYAYISATGDLLSKAKHKKPNKKLAKKYLKKYRKLHGISNKKQPVTYRCGGIFANESAFEAIKIGTSYALMVSEFNFKKEKQALRDNFTSVNEIEALKVLHRKNPFYVSKIRFDSMLSISTPVSAKRKESKTAFILKNDLWGVIDMYGNMQSPFQFSEVQYIRKTISGPPFFVKKQDKWALVDKNGHFLTQNTYLKVEASPYAQFFKVWTTTDKWGYVNNKGEEFFSD